MVLSDINGLEKMLKVGLIQIIYKKKKDLIKYKFDINIEF